MVCRLNLRGSIQFYRFGKGFLNPCRYLHGGRGTKMSRISFNRKKVKLKKLLGSARGWHLLALILVAPLMLERARSLEDARGKQVERDSAEFAKLAEHSADAQREVIASVQAVLKSAAHIYASAAKVGHGCDIMRDSLQVDLPWIRSLSVVGTDGTDPVLDGKQARFVGLNIGDRSYFQKTLETRDFVLQRLTCLPGSLKTTDRDGGLSGIGDQRRRGCRHRRRHQSRLDVESHGRPRRPSRHFGGSDRQRGHGDRRPCPIRPA